MRKNISTNTPSENRVGYSRAVRINNRMYFSGTTSMNENGDVMGSSLYEQSSYIFGKIMKVLGSEGFSRNDVIHVTAFLVHMEYLKEFDQAFKEFLGDVQPCCTLVCMKELVNPRLLIEIECIAEKENGSV